MSRTSHQTIRQNTKASTLTRLELKLRLVGDIQSDVHLSLGLVEVNKAIRELTPDTRSLTDHQLKETMVRQTAKKREWHLPVQPWQWTHSD